MTSKDLESKVEPVEVVRRPAVPRRSSSGVEQHGQWRRHQNLCRHLPGRRRPGFRTFGEEEIAADDHDIYDDDDDDE